MEEEDPRVRFRAAGADSGEVDPGEVGHRLVASGCLIPDRWAESER